MKSNLKVDLGNRVNFFYHPFNCQWPVAMGGEGYVLWKATILQSFMLYAMTHIAGTIDTTDCNIQGIKCDSLDADEA